MSSRLWRGPYGFAHHDGAWDQPKPVEAIGDGLLRGDDFRRDRPEWKARAVRRDHLYFEADARDGGERFRDLATIVLGPVRSLGQATQRLVEDLRVARGKV